MEEIDYQVLYESVIAENEKLRETISKLKWAKLDMDVFINMLWDVLRDAHYWIGVIMGAIIVLAILLIERIK